MVTKFLEKKENQDNFEFVKTRVLSVLEKIDEVIHPDGKPGVSEVKINELREIVKEYSKIKGKIIQKETTEAETGVLLSEIEFDSELLGALILVFEYINIINSGDSKRAEKGSAANNQLSRLLIQLSEKFGFSEDNLIYIYSKIFGSGPVYQELTNVSEDRKFAKGVYGVARALSYLKDQPKFSGAKFHEPSLEEDMKRKVDLKCETESELSLFQIKAFGRLETAVLFDLFSDHDRRELMETFRSNEQYGFESDIQEIIAYANELQGREDANAKKAGSKIRQVKAYWVQVKEDNLV